MNYGLGVGRGDVGVCVCVGGLRLRNVPDERATPVVLDDGRQRERRERQSCKSHLKMNEAAHLMICIVIKEENQ